MVVIKIQPSVRVITISASERCQSSFKTHNASHHCITANLFIFYARLASFLGAAITVGLVHCFPGLLQMFIQLNIDTNAGEVMTF